MLFVSVAWCHVAKVGANSNEYSCGVDVYCGSLLAGLYPVFMTAVDEWCSINPRTPQGMHAMLSMSNSSNCVFFADVLALKKRKR